MAKCKSNRSKSVVVSPVYPPDKLKKTALRFVRPPHVQGERLNLPDLPMPTDLRIFAREGNSFIRVPPHVNVSHFVLLISLAGSAEVLIDELPLLLKPGSAVLIFPDQWHKYKNPSREILWLFMSFKFPSPEKMFATRDKVLRLNACMWGNINSILESANKTEHENALAKGEAFVELWRLLTSLCACADFQKPIKGMRQHSLPHKYQILLNARQYIIANLAGKICINDVADHLEISVTTLQYLFHKHYRNSLGEHIRRTRIGHAAHLIINSDAPIKHITYKCGFNSMPSFSRAFTQIMGCTPSEYRAKAHKKR